MSLMVDVSEESKSLCQGWFKAFQGWPRHGVVLQANFPCKSVALALVSCFMIRTTVRDREFTAVYTAQPGVYCCW